MKRWLGIVFVLLEMGFAVRGQDLANAVTTKLPPVSRSRVTVRVLDKHTLQPVYANIIVVDQRPGRQIVPKFEDKVYKFRIPANDTSNITIYADGYETLNESISANELRPTEVFYLTKKSIDNTRSEVNPGVNASEVKPVFKEEITSVVYFNQSKTVMVTKSKQELERILDFLKYHQTYQVELAGHTDSKGDPAKNFRLSGERAEMVRQFLVANEVSTARIKSKAYGSKVPAAPNDCEQNRKLNRRVEMRLVPTL
ncbi:OmpA family protein [Dyadobacter sp. CY323]|uniref:OmpA family protein n=1 Tax=Dyadobacter sp. CY323 TaxID=2907302 RepID=UPI001F38FC79|nr:OmpA family protein [Dyadobacter sp. CY323]MCE6991922.1 OmpA family protein [Dyadobacter sp. CY323]